MINLFLLIVTIVNCILFVLILNWYKRIELFYDSTCTYLKSVRDHYKNIQDIYKHIEEVYQTITEQYDEVAKLMGWRNKDEE